MSKIDENEAAQSGDYAVLKIVRTGMRPMVSCPAQSRLEPMKNLVKRLQNHRELILNYFRAPKQYNSGIIEGMNRKSDYQKIFWIQNH